MTYVWELPRVEALLQRAETNLRVLEWFSRYLNLCPRYIKPEDVKSLVSECGVDEETAKADVQEFVSRLINNGLIENE